MIGNDSRSSPSNRSCETTGCVLNVPANRSTDEVRFASVTHSIRLMRKQDILQFPPDRSYRKN